MPIYFDSAVVAHIRFGAVYRQAVMEGTTSGLQRNGDLSPVIHVFIFNPEVFQMFVLDHTQFVCARDKAHTAVVFGCVVQSYPADNKIRRVDLRLVG